MATRQPGLVGPVLGVVRRTQCHGCLRAGRHGVPKNVRRGSLEYLPGIHGSVGHLDTWFLAALAWRPAAADGIDWRQVLAHRWLGSDRFRRFAQHRAAKQSQRSSSVRTELWPRQYRQVSQEEIQRHAAKEKRQEQSTAPRAASLDHDAVAHGS